MTHCKVDDQTLFKLPVKKHGSLDFQTVKIGQLFGI